MRRRPCEPLPWVRRLVLLAMVMTITLSASSCDDPAGPPTSIAGTWKLLTVNGVLPATPPGTTGVLMIGGELVLNEDSTFSSTIHYDTRGGPTSQTEMGTWRHYGDVVDFLDDNRVYARASVTSTRLTIDSRNSVFVYRR